MSNITYLNRQSFRQKLRFNQEAIDEITWLYNQLETARYHKMMLATALIGFILISASLFTIIYFAGLTPTL